MIFWLGLIYVSYKTEKNTQERALSSDEYKYIVAEVASPSNLWALRSLTRMFCLFKFSA